MYGVQVKVVAGDVGLAGVLTIPPDVKGMVVFAHGSGSSRFSPRNRAVAEVLNDAGMGTLLVDLLTPAEEARDQVTAELRFDVKLLADRVVSAIDWITDDDLMGRLPIGCFGASTGAAAALIATAERPDRVAAVVSRGGRPDLAGNILSRVRAPTLLIVGSRDPEVLRLNRMAQAAIAAECQLEIVEGATHLFEEPGALERVAELARDWFLRHFAAATSGRPSAAAGPVRSRPGDRS